MTPDDLDKLDALAAAARETWGDIDGPEWQGPNWIDSADLWPDQFDYEVAAYIAACDPATIRELVAMARLGAVWQAAEAALPEGWDGPRVGPLWVFDDAKHFGPAHRVPGAYEARAIVPDNSGYLSGEGPTPAAALLSLAEALRGRK